MTGPVVAFSELQLHTKATMAKLRVSGSRSLRLRRRDDEDLVLMTAARAEQEEVVVSAATKMFVAMMQRDSATSDLVIAVVPEAFPWVRFLPREDLQEFVLDLVSTLRAADALDNPAPVVQTIESWRHTAEVYADPELAAALSAATVGDHGVVPEPQAHM